MMLAGSEEKAFADRGLDWEVAVNLGARFEGGKFKFDYRRANGELRSRKIRTPDKKFWFEPKDAGLQFWGLETLPQPSDYRPKEPLVITEGEFDRIAVRQSCGGFALSVPNGAAGKRSETDIVIAEDTGFAYLWADGKVIPEVDQFDKIILATDGDDKGIILREELALRLGKTRCWYVTYPDGAKDANDVLLRYGPDALRHLIANAKPIRPGYLVKPSDIPPRPMIPTHSTGWAFLDAHLMIERPELMVVTGVPNHGKGQFIRCMTFNMARAHGWKTAYLAQEDPAHRIKRDMRRFALNRTPFAGPEQQREALAWIDQHFRISQMPDDEPVTLDMVEAEMESAVLHHDCQVFVLDPWNEIEHSPNRGEPETEYIGRTLRRLLRTIRKFNLLCIIAAHPTKLNGDEKPDLYRISGSANWKNKCQHGVIVHKPSQFSNTIELTVEKSKDWETMGRPGSIWMEFNRDKCDYFPIQQARDDNTSSRNRV